MPALRTRSEMPAQVFITREEQGPPRRTALTVASNSRRRVSKPSGGLWTSTHRPDDEFLCAWEEWCQQEQWFNGDTAWRLVPNAEATVVEINAHDDLVSLVAQFGRETRRDVMNRAEIDFDALRSAGFDGVHLTEDGQKACGSLFGDSPRLYGWDCESTVWFRWCFNEPPQKIRAASLHR